MNALATTPRWHVAAILVGRLIFAGVFAMAATSKFADMNSTAGHIAAAGFPFPLLLAWLAAFFETALVVCLLTGAYFAEAALLTALYVLFLAFAFHGPAHWKPDDPTEFGFFIDHFTFIAGLLFAAVHGPSSVLALRKSFIARR
jgi:putative oxidoreductase